MIEFLILLATAIRLLMSLVSLIEKAFEQRRRKWQARMLINAAVVCVGLAVLICIGRKS